MPASHSPRLQSAPLTAQRCRPRHQILTSSVLVITIFFNHSIAFAEDLKTSLLDKLPLHAQTGPLNLLNPKAPLEDLDLEKSDFAEGALAVNQTLDALIASPEAPQIQAVIHDQVEILVRAAEANLEIERLVNEKRAEMSDADLQRLLDADTAALVLSKAADRSQPFMRYVPGKNKSELTLKAQATTIDKQLISRVVLYDKDLAVITVNPDLVSRNSRHLGQYISRQLVDSHSGKGHDVLLVWSQTADLSQVTNVEYFKKPETTKERWKTFWISVYTPPSKGDVYVVTPFSLKWQLSMVASVGLASVIVQNMQKHAISLSDASTWNPAIWSWTAWTWAPMVLTTIFCVPLGIWSSTYRNIVQKPGDTKFVRVLKKSVVAALYAEAMLLALHGVGVDGLLDPVNQLKVFLNVLASKWSKDAYEYFVQIRTEMRLNTGTLNKMVLGEKVQIKNQSLEAVRVGQIPSAFKLADQTSFGKFKIDTQSVDGLLPVSIGGVDHQITATIGQILLYGLILPVNYAVLRWAEKVGYKKAGVMRKDWNTTKKVVTAPFWGPVWLAKQGALKCVSLLKNISAR